MRETYDVPRAGYQRDALKNKSTKCLDYNTESLREIRLATFQLYFLNGSEFGS